jgi:hypothetical protein
MHARTSAFVGHTSLPLTLRVARRPLAAGPSARGFRVALPGHCARAGGLRMRPSLRAGLFSAAAAEAADGRLLLPHCTLPTR